MEGSPKPQETTKKGEEDKSPENPLDFSEQSSRVADKMRDLFDRLRGDDKGSEEHDDDKPEKKKKSRIKNAFSKIFPSIASIENSEDAPGAASEHVPFLFPGIELGSTREKALSDQLPDTEPPIQGAETVPADAVNSLEASSSDTTNSEIVEAINPIEALSTPEDEDDDSDSTSVKHVKATANTPLAAPVSTRHQQLINNPIAPNNPQPNPNAVPTPTTPASYETVYPRYATRREAAAYSLLAFAGAERIDHHRDKKRKADIRDLEKKGKEQDKHQEKLQENQQDLEREAHKRQAERMRATVNNLEKKPEVVDSPVAARAEREIVSEKTVSSEKAPERKPEKNTPTTDVISKTNKVEQQTSAEMDSRLVLEQTAAAAERGIAVETYYERRHEAKDDQSLIPGPYVGSSHSSDSLSNIPSLHSDPGHSSTSDVQISPRNMAKEPVKSGDKGYKKAVISGFATAVVILGVILVVAVLTS